MNQKQTIKFAAPSSDEFETAFANLAFSVLQSEAPMLLEYLIGFELIDKNDEETHAVGVFGFKVGKQMLFAPVFFINGQLKGNELLYIDNMDVFVPRTDGWVQYLLNRRPYILGGGESQTESDLGISAPDINRFSESPSGGAAGFLTKYNSAKAEFKPKFCSEWAKESIGMFQWDAGKYRCLTKLAKFIDDTAKWGTSVVLAKTLRKHAGFRENFVNVYGDLSPFLKKAELVTNNHAVQDSKQPSADNVEIFSNSDVLNDILSDNDKERILRRELVVKDHRNNTSKVYKAELSASLTNPTESGVYDILMQEGKFERLHVFMQPQVIGTGKSNVALLVSTTSGKPWGYYYPRDLWTTGKVDNEEKNLFSSATSIDGVEIGGVYMLINDENQVTTPFRVLRKVSNAVDESTDIYVRPYEDYSLVRSNKSSYNTASCIHDRNTSYPDAFTGTEYCSFYADFTEYPTNDGYDPEKEFWYKGRRIIYLKNDTSKNIRKLGKATIVSPEFKALRLDNAADKKVEWHNEVPGTLVDLTMELLKTSSVAPLTVINDGLHTYITAGNEQLGPLSKQAAAKHFITKWGMDLSTAQLVLDQRGKQKYLVKLAISAPAIPEPTTSMDSIMGYPAQQSLEQSIPVDGLQAGGDDDSLGLNDINMMRNSANLAQSNGQTDMFDTAIMSGLVKAVKVDGIIDKYLSDIILGLDRVGRILFMYYWHNDKFKERYGQEDLIELEDSLRNVFSGLGELVLFLKKRTASESIGSQAATVDLSELL